MAAATDGAAQTASAKGSLQKYLQEAPDQYNLDDVEDSLDDGGENNIIRRGHTKNDRKDMSRMGKRQELIVSFPTRMW